MLGGIKIADVAVPLVRAVIEDDGVGFPIGFFELLEASSRKPRLANSSIRNMQRYPSPSGLLAKVLIPAVMSSRSHVL